MNAERFRQLDHCDQCHSFGHYDFTFPDNRPVKLVRRGILDCSATATNCEFVPPESVSSVN